MCLIFLRGNNFCILMNLSAASEEFLELTKSALQAALEGLPISFVIRYF